MSFLLVGLERIHRNICVSFTRKCIILILDRMIPAHIEYMNVIKLLRIAVSNCLFNFLKSTRLVASVTKFKKEWMSILVMAESDNRVHS